MANEDRNFGSPLYAAVGVGDLALQSVADVIAQLRQRSNETRDRIAGLPEEIPDIDELRGRFTPDELRRVAEAYIEVATGIYNSLAERGEVTVDRIKGQSAGQIGKAEKAYNEALDSTEEAIGNISTQTRSVGDRAAALAGAASEKVAGVAGLIEAKGRTAKSSPAKKLEEAKKSAEQEAAKAPAQKPTPTKAPAKKAPAKKVTAKKAPAKKAPAKKAAPTKKA